MRINANRSPVAYEIPYTHARTTAEIEAAVLVLSIVTAASAEENEQATPTTAPNKVLVGCLPRVTSCHTKMKAEYGHTIKKIDVTHHLSLADSTQTTTTAAVTKREMGCRCIFPFFPVDVV